MTLRPLLSFLFILAALASGARAQVKASLVAADESIQAGRPFTVALRLEHEPHWHTYWLNAGTGFPTDLAWNLPPDWTAGPIRWPVPGLIRDKEGHVTGHGFEGITYLPVTLTPPARLTETKVTLKATASWLMCADVCMPGEAAVQLGLPINDAAPKPGSASLELAKVSLPEHSSGWQVSAQRKATTVTLEVKCAGELGSPHFFPADGLIAYDEPQQIEAAKGVLILTLSISKDADASLQRLVGVLAYTDAQSKYRGETIDCVFSEKPTVAVPTPPPGGVVGNPGTLAGVGGSFTATLGLAFLGGLILNLMPCVFPVLGIKILGFVNHSGQDRSKVTLHGLTFALGVLLSFWMLAGLLAALRAGGGQLGWGFQLQSPGFVFTLAALILVFALSLSGVFEFGLRATSVGASLQMREGFAGSFFTGVLATVVATPCSAPFLAPALGAALALPLAASFAVFTAIALGLALPYLLLSVFPSAIRLLPRPGAWMESFKQLMAFPLYATVGYLLWVFAGQTEENGLLMAFFGLTYLAMAAWCYGRWATPAASAARRRHVILSVLVIALCGFWTGWPRAAAPTDIAWQPWSPEAVAQATAAGKTVYADFTARWCATCQTNKKIVFASEEVRRVFRERGIVTLKADWTNRDPRITEELARWNRSAVPFNLVIKPGKPPQPLPELLTPNLVLEAVQRP